MVQNTKHWCVSGIILFTCKSKTGNERYEIITGRQFFTDETCKSDYGDDCECWKVVAMLGWEWMLSDYVQDEGLAYAPEVKSGLDQNQDQDLPLPATGSGPQGRWCWSPFQSSLGSHEH